MPGIDDIGRIREIVNAIRSNIGTKPGRVFYVNAATGTTVYDGLSRDHPVLTINTAIGLAGHGDIIHVARGTYDEAVSIPAGKIGLQIICEPGVYIVNTDPGTVVAIASDCVYWEGGILETNGQIGMDINANWLIGKNIHVYNCTVGFDMNGHHPLLINCFANDIATTGFDISDDSGVYIDCTCHGLAASRGFYFSHTNAHFNILLRCATVGCTAAGYELVVGADENLLGCCIQSAVCGGPINAGANNTFASHSEGSVITAGNSLQEDLSTIETYVDELESRLTAARAGYLDGIPRILCSMDFWSVPQEEVAITAGAGDKPLPDVTVADLPAGATVVRAIAMFKFRMVENTNAGANSLSGAQEIQVRDDTPGAWTDAINFVASQFSIAASTREGGDVIIGAIDVAATVDGNDTYNLQWDEAVAALANLQFNDVQVGLRIWYSL